MLNTEPVINVAVDHSVAMDVKEGDYYGIKVKEAKIADTVRNITLESVVSDDDTVDFKVNGNEYKKKINNVSNASVAEYDNRGRKLSELLEKKDVSSLVNRAVTDASLVTSVNGKNGNVYIEASDLGLENVDNTSDLDKPISKATQAEIDAVKSDYQSALVLTEQEFTRQIATLTIAFDALRSYVNNLEHRIAALETDGTSGGGTPTPIDNTIYARVATLEAEQTATTAKVSALETNSATKTELSNVRTSLSGSISGVQSDVSDLSDNLSNNYYTSATINTKLSDYSTLTDTADAIATATNGMATTSYVNDAIDNIDYSDYVTNDDLATYQTEVSNTYATQDTVNNLDLVKLEISEDENGIVDAKISNKAGGYVELNNYSDTSYNPEDEDDEPTEEPLPEVKQ